MLVKFPYIWQFVILLWIICIILFSRFISIKAIMRQSIDIFPRSACHKIMVGNFQHWPNYRVYIQAQLQVQTLSFLTNFWRSSILQQQKIICQTMTNQVTLSGIFFGLYLKGLSLHLDWTMATWVRNCVVLLSPSSWTPCWDLQPCTRMSVEN